MIVPCFNYGQYLAECLSSVQAQSYECFECIVVNDGSTDDTIAVTRGFSKSDARFKLVTQSNQGLPAARNSGLQIAQGEFVQLLDADDKLEKDKFKKQVEFFLGHLDVDLVYGDCAYFRSRAPLDFSPGLKGSEDVWMPKVSGQGYDLIRRLLVYNIMVVSSPLFRSQLLSSCGLFDESLESLEDWELWLRFALNGVHFRYAPGEDTRALIRVHDRNMSSDELKMCEASLAIRSRIAANLGDYRLRILNCLRAIQISKDVSRMRRKAGSAKSGWNVLTPLQSSHGRSVFAAALAWWALERMRSALH